MCKLIQVLQEKGYRVRSGYEVNTDIIVDVPSRKDLEVIARILLQDSYSGDAGKKPSLDRRVLLDEKGLKD